MTRRRRHVKTGSGTVYVIDSGEQEAFAEQVGFGGAEHLVQVLASKGLPSPAAMRGGLGEQAARAKRRTVPRARPSLSFNLFGVAAGCWMFSCCRVWVSACWRW